MRHHEAEGRDLIYSDEDEDFSSVEEGSDSDLPHLDQSTSGAGSGVTPKFKSWTRKNLANKNSSASGGTSARQRQNLKQKFVALLRKFKVTDPDELEQEQVSLDQKLSEGTVDPAEIEDLFDQLEEFSSGGEDDLLDPDTISIGSTPKPSLKPFFNSSRSLHRSAGSKSTTTGEKSSSMSRGLSLVTAELDASEFLSC